MKRVRCPDRPAPSTSVVTHHQTMICIVRGTLLMYVTPYVSYLRHTL
jgi:hypothetical protein